MKPIRHLAAGGALAALVLTQTAAADQRGTGAPEWSPGKLVIAGGGCPIETPDEQSLMFASGRPGGQGDIDIWVIDRSAVGEPWGAPKNLAAPVNSAAADFCPAPDGRSLFFVSSRAVAGACGGGDIFLTRQSPAGDWSEPVHLPCAPNGPNTSGTERSPSLVETWYGSFLYYSSNGGIADGDDDIYVSVLGADGEFGRGYRVDALSVPDYDDQMPTVRARGGGRYEVTFNSNRPGWGPGGRGEVYGAQDVYYAQSSFGPFAWGAPVNAGPNVNTAASETRASLSVDGERLYYGRGDIFVSEREGWHNR